MGKGHFGTGEGHFGTDGKRSCWDTFVSARVEQLQKINIIGGVGARNHKSLMPRAQTLITLDVLNSVTRDIVMTPSAFCVKAKSAMLDFVAPADPLL